MDAALDDVRATLQDDARSWARQLRATARLLEAARAGGGADRAFVELEIAGSWSVGQATATRLMVEAEHMHHLPAGDPGALETGVLLVHQARVLLHVTRDADPAAGPAGRARGAGGRRGRGDVPGGPAGARVAGAAAAGVRGRAGRARRRSATTGRPRNAGRGRRADAGRDGCRGCGADRRAAGGVEGRAGRARGAGPRQRPGVGRRPDRRPAPGRPVRRAAGAGARGPRADPTSTGRGQQRAGASAGGAARARADGDRAGAVGRAGAPRRLRAGQRRARPVDAPGRLPPGARRRRHRPAGAARRPPHAACRTTRSGAGSSCGPSCRSRSRPPSSSTAPRPVTTRPRGWAGWSTSATGAARVRGAGRPAPTATTPSRGPPGRPPPGTCSGCRPAATAPSTPAGPSTGTATAAPPGTAPSAAPTSDRPRTRRHRVVDLHAPSPPRPPRGPRPAAGPRPSVTAAVTCAAAVTPAAAAPCAARRPALLSRRGEAVRAASYGDGVSRDLTAAQVRAFRVRTSQLDREHGTLADTAVLAVGVQDTGPDGARWALANRGVTSLDPADLALLWTIRGAPHVYRRADLPHVVAAAAPYSETDAAKRIYDAAKPLKQAGIPVLEALDRIAAELRDLVPDRMVKGELSGAVTARLPAPYVRECVPCGRVVHPWEMPFRLGALRAGLELEPGTSPPVLRRVPDLEPVARRPVRPRAPAAAPARAVDAEARRRLPRGAGRRRAAALAAGRRRRAGRGRAAPGARGRRRAARRRAGRRHPAARAVRPAPAGARPRAARRTTRLGPSRCGRRSAGRAWCSPTAPSSAPGGRARPARR